MTRSGLRDNDRSMTPPPDFTVVASAIGEPARGKMLNALMDGRALTATELALEAGVTPSTASSHLEKLQQAGLIARTAQGRHRYFRIAAVEIAEILESLMGIATADRKTRSGPRNEALRRARVCYDHLAGELGVRLLERMRERQLMRRYDQFLELTAPGEKWANEFGIDLDGLRRKSRPLVAYAWIGVNGEATCPVHWAPRFSSACSSSASRDEIHSAARC